MTVLVRDGTLVGDLLRRRGPVPRPDTGTGALLVPVLVLIEDLLKVAGLDFAEDLVRVECTLGELAVQRFSQIGLARPVGNFLGLVLVRVFFVVAVRVTFVVRDFVSIERRLNFLGRGNLLLLCRMHDRR